MHSNCIKSLKLGFVKSKKSLISDQNLNPTRGLDLHAMVSKYRTQSMAHSFNKQESHFSFWKMQTFLHHTQMTNSYHDLQTDMTWKLETV